MDMAKWPTHLGPAHRAGQTQLSCIELPHASTLNPSRDRVSERTVEESTAVSSDRADGGPHGAGFLPHGGRPRGPSVITISPPSPLFSKLDHLQNSITDDTVFVNLTPSTLTSLTPPSRNLTIYGLTHLRWHRTALTGSLDLTSLSQGAPPRMGERPVPNKRSGK